METFVKIEIQKETFEKLKGKLCFSIEKSKLTEQRKSIYQIYVNLPVEYKADRRRVIKALKPLGLGFPTHPASAFRGFLDGGSNNDKTLALAYWYMLRKNDIIEPICKIFGCSKKDISDVKSILGVFECGKTNEQTHLGVARADPTVAHWQVISGKLQSVDPHTFTIELDDRKQTRSTNNPIDLFLSTSLGVLYTSCSYKFGMRSVIISTNIHTVQECDVEYPEKLKSVLNVAANGEMRFLNTGVNRSLGLDADHGILEGVYELDECHFISIKPHGNQFSFSAEMLVQKHDLSLSKIDGSKIDDENKRLVIASLLLHEVGVERENGRIRIARKTFDIVPDVEVR